MQLNLLCIKTYTCQKTLGYTVVFAYTKLTYKKIQRVNNKLKAFNKTQQFRTLIYIQKKFYEKKVILKFCFEYFKSNKFNRTF